MSPNFLNKTSR